MKISDSQYDRSAIYFDTYLWKMTFTRLIAITELDKYTL